MALGTLACWPEARGNGSKPSSATSWLGNFWQLARPFCASVSSSVKKSYLILSVSTGTRRFVNNRMKENSKEELYRSDLPVEPRLQAHVSELSLQRNLPGSLLLATESGFLNKTQKTLSFLKNAPFPSPVRPFLWTL